MGGFIEETGWKEAQDRIIQNDNIQSQRKAESVNGLFNHIRSKAITSAEFSRVPYWYYKPDSPMDKWWKDLDYLVVQQGQSAPSFPFVPWSFQKSV